MITVFQTWKTIQLPEPFAKYHETWKQSFVTILSNDSDVISDILLFCLNNNMNFCKDLKYFTRIQIIDIWRYIKIYIEGGVYSDIDIGIKKPHIIQNWHENCHLAVLRESPAIHDEPLKFWIYVFRFYLGFSSYCRFEQFRQSFFYAKPNHPFLYNLLNNIEHNRNMNEPQLTFELTGPGIFTDQLYHHINESSTCLIGYNEGLDIIDYHHFGTWKTYEETDETPWFLFIFFISNVSLLLYIMRHSKIWRLFSRI